MTTKKLKTTKRSERKKASKRTEKNRGVRRSIASSKTTRPSYLERGTGSLADAYHSFLGNGNVSDLSPEIALARAQQKTLIGALNLVLQTADVTEETLARKDPDERLDTLKDFFGRVEKPVALINATATTLGKLIKTFVTAELASNVVPAARAQIYLEYLVNQYHKAVLTVLDRETAATIDNLFAELVERDGQDLKDIIREIETRHAQKVLSSATDDEPETPDTKT